MQICRHYKGTTPSATREADSATSGDRGKFDAKFGGRHFGRLGLTLGSSVAALFRARVAILPAMTKMYAQIFITAKYDGEKLRQALTNHIGASAIPAVEALRRAGMAGNARAAAPTVVAAQGLRNAVTILYFFDGPDTIFIQILAKRMTNLTTQAERARPQGSARSQR